MNCIIIINRIDRLITKFSARAWHLTSAQVDNFVKTLFLSESIGLHEK